MDTRLIELLPRAMNLRNGDAKVIKNAGAIVSHPFGSVMRSILVAVYDLLAAEVAVVGHYGCGMTGLSSAHVLQKAAARGISQETLLTLQHAGIDLQRWLTGFDSPEDGVRQSVAVIRQHPLLPKDVPVYAVGGVGAGNMTEWRQAGAAGFGMGSDLFKPEFNDEEIAARARQSVAAFQAAG